MKKQDLDFILVPLGIAILSAYHLWLLHRIIKHPTKTVVGINSIHRRLWVQTMMKDPAKYGVLAVQTLRNNIMASTLLSTTAIMLCSVIAYLMTNSVRISGESFKPRGQDLVVGDTSNLGLSIKLFSILVCYMLAFLLNIQSVRYYSHASILINSPPPKLLPLAEVGGVEYVTKAVNKGSYFWSTGLHAFYVSLPFFLWIFGPIPMLVCCLLLVCLLYFLDVHSGYSLSVGDDEKKEDNDDGLARVFG
ncbi:hypothetical protein Cni_G13911 [Canna indica]|uniref:DUF599 domain-containing protein n=1 Tax=Canna indica TaxID=4628 RepID=A0AAQ3KB16_9LILI|nr:hypothetical protein Cni_G13911 [Canna indica]